MSAANEAMEANDRERARLAALLARLERGDFTAELSPGWTVTAALGHIAFWDRIALTCLERWAAGLDYEATRPAWYDDAVNDALLVESRALIPAVARQLALASADAIDGRLRGLGAARVERLFVDHDAAWLLRRHVHRAEHLDAIEGVLGR